jgi:hypothetical protein
MMALGRTLIHNDNWDPQLFGANYDFLSCLDLHVIIQRKITGFKGKSPVNPFL